MASNNFSPTGYGEMIVAPYISSAQAVPGGGGPTLQVTNLGPNAAVVILGSNTVVVTQATGVLIPVNQSRDLAVGSATYIAGMALGGINSRLYLSQGT